mmetsp:Transcript_49213/g.151952  ORF Transcript_49213/g.151952 Transcript_49213/m.151952 type:complete len:331 (-) Transcript_49213:192-1184(-)
MPSFSSSAMACRRSSTLTCTGGTYSAGPRIIHFSPGCRGVLPSWKLSTALSRIASSLASTTMFSTPLRRRSPGCRKKDRSPRRISISPNRFLPSAPTGSITMQNCRLLSVVTLTSHSTFSYTCGMCVAVSLCVISHCSPARRALPNTSVNDLTASRCSASFSVSTLASTKPSTSSSTAGRYAPSLRTSHSSPTSRVTPARSVKRARARRRSAVLALMIWAFTVCTTSTSMRGMYVSGPSNIHSSPALRATSPSLKSRTQRSRSAEFFGTTVSFLIGVSLSSPTSTSPGISANGSCSKRISSSPTRRRTCPYSSVTGASLSSRTHGLRMRQ